MTYYETIGWRSFFLDLGGLMARITLCIDELSRRNIYANHSYAVTETFNLNGVLKTIVDFLWTSVFSSQLY